MWQRNAGIEILTVVLFCLFVKINGQGEQCYSPSGSYGICVVLPQCPSLIYYYGQSRGNRQVINYLLAAQRNCATRRIGNNPIVCCDNPVIDRTVTIQNPYQPQPATTQSPYQPQQPEFPPEEPFSQLPTQPPTQRTTQPSTRLTTLQTTTVAPTTPTPTDARTAGQSCKDPNGYIGACTNIKECPSVLNKFIANPNDGRYIRYIKISNSICGNIQSFICCRYEEKNEVPSTSETFLPNEPVDTFEPIRQDQTPNDNAIQGRLLIPEEGCGYSYNSSTRIVGGKPTKIGAYPWMALLGYENNFGERSWKCGGSLITTRHVLSAAHCVISTLSLARLGEYDISSSTETEVQDIKIIRSIKHPEYDKRDGTSDIAVLYLEHDAQLSSRVNPICIPFMEPERSRNVTNYRPLISGWGRLLEGGKSSNVLQELQIPVHGNDVCRDRYQKQGKLLSNKQFDNKILCAGDLGGGHDSCQGDSGGPLVQPFMKMKDKFHFYQIGVVSYGIGCARPDIPGVYTSVQHFVSWIQERVNE